MSSAYSRESDFDSDSILRVAETVVVNLKINIQIRFKSVQYVEPL